MTVPETANAGRRQPAARQPLLSLDAMARVWCEPGEIYLRKSRRGGFWSENIRSPSNLQDRLM